MKFYLFIKRTTDIFVSLLALIILSPLFLLTAIAVGITSKGPIIFAQERHGKDKKLFKCYKFRTMKSTTVKFDVNNVVISQTNKNVTKVGRILRKLKIDELPQLVNVLKGDMSIVGHRPFMPEYMANYEPWELQKFAVRPGLTGLNQVNGNGYLTTKERSYYDVYYAKHISLWLDIKIFFKTFLIILAGEKRFLRNVPQEKIDAMKEQYESNVASREQPTDSDIGDSWQR